MAKIKSTLDLVMERTKNIAINQADKEALQRKEWEDKARGWVKMLVDGKIAMRELVKEYSEESPRYRPLAGILRRNLLGEIDPDADNGIVLQALAELLGVDAAPISGSIKEYHVRHERHRQEHQVRLRNMFEEMGISGTALVPNLEGDDAWIAFVKGLKEQFTQEIMAS
jgi:hypothetical protein